MSPWTRYHDINKFYTQKGFLFGIIAIQFQYGTDHYLTPMKDLQQDTRKEKKYEKKKQKQKKNKKKKNKKNNNKKKTTKKKQQPKTATNHYENKPIQIYWKFYHKKMKIFK